MDQPTPAPTPGPTPGPEPYIDPEYGPISGNAYGYGPAPANSRLVKILLMVIVLMLVLGTVALVGVLGRPQADPDPDCKGTIESVMRRDRPADHQLVLVDVPSNDDLDVRNIARTVASHIAATAPDGVRVELLYDFGADAGIVMDRCFDGSRTLYARKANSTNQVRLEATLGDAIAEQVMSQLKGQTVSDRGGPIRLLRQADRLSGTDTEAWFLWSDLLANDGSCLDATGSEAIPKRAGAVVNRCLSTGDLPETTPPLVLRGAGESFRTGPFDGFARNIELALCRRLETCEQR